VSMSFLRRLFSALPVLLAACSAGSVTPTVQSPVTKQAHFVAVSLTIRVPAVSAQPATTSVVRPKYVSPSTESATVTVTPASGSPVTAMANCTTQCTLTVDAPIGQDVFAVSLFNQPNGAGSALSKGSVTSTIVADKANSISLTFNGVPASVALSIDTQPVVHTPSTVHLTVNAEDINGNIIIGPGAYPTITLTNDDSTGTVVLASSQATAPNATIAVTYNGNWISTGNASANITATIAGTSATGTIAISPQPIETSYIGATSNLDAGADITAGPDGALWFVENDYEIDRITTTGTVSHFAAPQTRIPFAITTGSDGALWFTDGDAGATDVGRITTSGTASICTGASGGISITSGSDGNLWIGSSFPAQIVRVTPTCVVTAFPDAAAANIQHITSGPDGAIWFTSEGSTDGVIGRVSTSGSVSTYTLPGMPYPNGIVAGPDGYLWFAEGSSFEVGRISTAGAVTMFQRPNGLVGAQGDIVVGPDGAMWFDNAGGGVGRISETGQYTIYQLGVTPFRLTLGSDNALWGLDFSNGNIARVSI
jgi:virginiamycin B lyase